MREKGRRGFVPRRPIHGNEVYASTGGSIPIKRPLDRREAKSRRPFVSYRYECLGGKLQEKRRWLCPNKNGYLYGVFLYCLHSVPTTSANAMLDRRPRRLDSQRRELAIRASRSAEALGFPVSHPLHFAFRGRLVHDAVTSCSRYLARMDSISLSLRNVSLISHSMRINADELFAGESAVSFMDCSECKS
jgi:hypothetical protein